jgi:hypothetical protein
MDCAQTKRKWHCPWCEDDTCMLGWGIVMHQVMVWAKAAELELNLYLFLFRCARSRGGLHIKIKRSFFLPEESDNEQT